MTLICAAFSCLLHTGVEGAVRERKQSGNQAPPPSAKVGGDSLPPVRRWEADPPSLDIVLMSCARASELDAAPVRAELISASPEWPGLRRFCVCGAAFTLQGTWYNWLSANESQHGAHQAPRRACFVFLCCSTSS